MSNKRGPWVLIMNMGQPTAMARTIASFPAAGLVADEAFERYPKIGLDQVRNASMLLPAVIRGVPGYVPAPGVDRIRAELRRFECQQTQLLLDGVLPCDGAGAVMLERDGDGWRVVRNYSECRGVARGVAA